MERSHRLALALVLLAVPSRVASQCELAKLTASDAAIGDRLGMAVAVLGDTALVGASNRNAGAGAVYVLERAGAGWVEVQTIVAGDSDPGDAFGGALALTADYALVGADRDDEAGEDAGAAYVFERAGGLWIQAAKLTAADAEPGDSLGQGVALDGALALVGMHHLDDVTGGPGSAYVFERVAGVWSETARLDPSDGEPGDHFGIAVGVRGESIVVGARNDNQAAFVAGSVYLFERQASIWVELGTITAADAAPGDFFGCALAFDGERLAVGASQEVRGGIGAAYVLEGSGASWSEVAKLTAPDGALGDFFGQRIALSGDTVLVGAWSHDGAAPDSGAAYLFRADGATWALDHELAPADAVQGQLFGRAVALAGDVALVGAPFDARAGAQTGAAYAFSASGAGFPALAASRASISLASGGSQALALETCVQYGGLVYFLLGSATGTQPGISDGSFTLPLNLDGYFLFTLFNPNTLIAGSLSLLDASGEAAAALALPPGLSPTLAGVTLNHAYVVIALPGTGETLFVSTPASLALVP